LAIVSAPSPGTVVVFLAGDPSLAARRSSVPAAVGGPWRLVAPGNLLLGAPGRKASTPFPAEQVMCAQRLMDAAKSRGRTVEVVDVNDPGPDRALVERWVSSADILPLAVRSDGARLEGAEAFTRAAVDAFLSRP
jgi:hypothetical protein